MSNLSEPTDGFVGYDLLGDEIMDEVVLSGCYVGQGTDGVLGERFRIPSRINR